MPPGNNRFGGPTLASTPFTQSQQAALPHNSQHQASNSGGLPPPSFHNGFSQGNPNSVNPFALTNGLAGGFGPGGGLGSGGTGLASQAAMAGFQHGAQLEHNQRQMRDQIRRGSGVGGASKASMRSRIRDVWRPNLHQEMRILRELVERYPYISMVRLCPIYVPLTSLPRCSNRAEVDRTLSFLASSLGPWAPSLLKPTTITKP